MGKGYRQGRLGKEIQRIISKMLLTELKDPRLDGMISISGVDVSGDNGYATVYILLMERGEDEEATCQREEDVLAGFNSARGKIRGQIGREIKLRRTPELTFKIDRSQEYGRKIDELLRRLDIED